MGEERLGQKEELVQRPRIHQVSLPEGTELLGTTQPRESVHRAELARPPHALLPVEKF